jgi:hypothetical protein
LAFFFQTKFSSVRQARASVTIPLKRKLTLSKTFPKENFSSKNAFVLFGEKVLEKGRGDWLTEEL